MQNSVAFSSASHTPFVPAPFTPPAHVKRWTGRATPTIFLPSLAALRLEAHPLRAASAVRSGN